MVQLNISWKLKLNDVEFGTNEFLVSWEEKFPGLIVVCFTRSSLQVKKEGIHLMPVKGTPAEA